MKIKFKTVSQKFSVTFALVAAIVLLSGFQTIQRNAEWKDDMVLCTADEKKVPNSFNVYENLGIIFTQNGQNASTLQERNNNFNRALSEYDTAINIYPKYPVTWRNIGMVYLFMGNNNEAIQAYHKCIDADSTFSMGYDDLGMIYFKEKNYEKALNYFKKSAQIDSTNVLFCFNIGLCYHILGQYENAILYYKKTLSLFSKLPLLDQTENQLSPEHVKEGLLNAESLLQNEKQ